MDRAEKRNKAEQELARMSRVIAACLAQADDGHEYFSENRSRCESLMATLRTHTDSDVGTKRLIAVSREMRTQVERLEADYTADRERRIAEARAEAERERHQRLVEAMRADAQRQPRPVSKNDVSSLGVIFDMRNEGPG